MTNQVNRGIIISLSEFRQRCYAPVAQLDRVFGYEPKGRGFESLQAYQSRKIPLLSQGDFFSTQWHLRLAFGEPQTLIASALFPLRTSSAILLRKTGKSARVCSSLMKIFLVTMSQSRIIPMLTQGDFCLL